MPGHPIDTTYRRLFFSGFAFPKQNHFASFQTKTNNPFTTYGDGCMLCLNTKMFIF